MKTFVIVILFLLTYTTYAQSKFGFEYQIFKNFCNELIESNDKYEAKKTLDGSIQLLIDPISLVHTFDTIGILSNEASRILNKTNKEELIEIFKIGSAPFLPLSKSIIIIDTTGFFSQNYSYSNSNYTFIISEVQKSENHIDDNVFYLYASGCRNNEFVLSFLFQSRKYILNCYFQFDNIINMNTRLYYFENIHPH